MDERTTIDLKKPADLIMVNRAICNGWDVHHHIRDQIVEQMHDALAHYQDMEAKGGRSAKQINQLLRIIRLMKNMEARNMVDEGIAPQSAFPNLRRRQYPERPRRSRINRQQIRINEALARKAAREAAAK